MTGSDALAEQGREQADADRRRVAARRCSACAACGCARSGAPIDVEVRAGELVGVAGLEGHGQNEFLEALRGGSRRRRARSSATSPTAARSTIRSPAARCRSTTSPTSRGSAASTRSSAGCRSARTSRCPRSPRHPRRPGSARARRGERFDGYVEPPRDRARRRPRTRSRRCSGGNQQKVVIARWLAFGPEVLLLNDPTRGIDIGAKNDLYALLGALASEGLAVVMLSTEVDEHVELMDRVLVFREHELFRRSTAASSRARRLVVGLLRRGRGMSSAGAVRAARCPLSRRGSRRGARCDARRRDSPDYSFGFGAACWRSALLIANITTESAASASQPARDRRRRWRSPRSRARRRSSAADSTSRSRR